MDARCPAIVPGGGGLDVRRILRSAAQSVRLRSRPPIPDGAARSFPEGEAPRSAGHHRGLADLYLPAGLFSADRRALFMDVPLIVVLVVMTALVFDFTNGFHDTANAMATSIATGALRPKVAVAIAGLLNLVGAFLSVEVAKTISGGLVDETLVNPVVIFAGLVGAIMWNLVTWLLGLPSSSSHALFGGLIGATWVAGGVDAIHVNTVLNKVILPAVLSPVVAALIALTVTYLAFKVTDRVGPGVVDRG